MRRNLIKIRSCVSTKDNALPTRLPFNFYSFLLHTFIIFPPQCFYSLVHNFIIFPPQCFYSLLQNFIILLAYSWIPSLSTILIFPHLLLILLLILLLHNFYYFPSSIFICLFLHNFIICLLHLHLLIYSIYFSTHKYIDLLSTLHQPYIDCKSTPHRPYIDPTSTLHRPHFDPISTLHRPHIDPTSTLHRSHIDPTSIPHRPYIAPTSTPHQPYIDPTSTPHRPHIDPRLTFFKHSLVNSEYIQPPPHLSLQNFFIPSSTFLLATLSLGGRWLWPRRLGEGRRWLGERNKL